MVYIQEYNLNTYIISDLYEKVELNKEELIELYNKIHIILDKYDWL